MTFYLCVDGKIWPLTNRLLLIMKLIAFLTVITVLQATAAGFAQTITLAAENKPLAKVMEEVKEQSGYHFFIAGEQIANKTVNVSFQNADLDEAMEILTRDLGVEWVIRKKVIVLREATDQPARFRTVEEQPIKQERIIIGKVADESGIGLEGVTVTAKGSTTTVITDSQGNYRIELPAGADLLRFSMVGYISVEQTVGLRSSIDVVLVTSISDLDEVVVVGYGTQKKANLTGAVDQIDAKVIDALQVNTIGEALQGQIPNLNVNIADGRPGRAASFNIRGTTSINGGSPLIIIDGVASSEDELNSISPKDIEKVSVLKDASSAAIYGARGAFGVILVTTKRAQPGQTQISYSNNFGWSTPTRVPELYHAPDYTSIINDFAANVGQSYFTAAQVNNFEQAWTDPSIPAAEYTNSVSSLTLFGNKLNNYYEDWFREYTPKQNHHISVLGGTEKFSYFLSGDYNHEQGNLKIKPDKVNRYSLRSNVNYKINDNITIFNNTSITSRSDDMAFTRVYNWVSNVYRMIELINPYVPESVNVNGAEMLTDMGYYRRFIGDYTSNTTVLNGFSTTPGVDVSLFNGDLKIHADFTYKQSNNNSLQKSDIRIPLLYLYSNNNAIRDSYPNGSSFIARTMYNSKSTYANAYATYDKQFADKHHVTLMGGVNLEDTYYFSLRGQRSNPFQIVQESLNLADGVATTSENDTKTATQSTFFRANYNFDERYLMEINGAYNISSKFPQGKRDALFFSVSGAWRISQERFFDSARDIISDMKLRGSFGSLGNQNIGAFDYLSTLAMSQTSYTLEGTRENYTQAPSPTSANFTWETSETVDIGLDVSFLRNRLTFNGDVYQRNTVNMLAKFHSLPSVFGATVPRENNAKLKTRGWEVSMGWSDMFALSGKSFHYGLRAGISDYTSEIVDFANPTNYLGDYYIGQTIGEIWGLTNDGYFETDEEALNGALLNTSGHRGYTGAGNIRFKDFDQNGEISRGNWTLGDHGDYRIIGNTTPRYQYSLTLNASWNGFDINAFFRGVGKRDVYPDENAIVFWGPFAKKYAIMPTFVGENIWTPENPNAYFPRPQAYIASGSNDLGVSQTSYLQDASYLRLKNLALGYTLPQSVSKKVKLEKLRIYLVGQNLFESTRLHEAFDPEGLSDDPDGDAAFIGMGTAYPVQRIYTVGLELQF